MLSPENAPIPTQSAVQRHALIDDARLENGLAPDSFREVFRNHASGVAVITADAGDGPAAMTATSVFSVSATPPLLVFSVSSVSSAAPTILAAASVVVHLLGTGQVELARLCATSGVDRFADPASWSRLATGEPYYVDAPVWVRGQVMATFQAGMSTLVVVNATHAQYPPADSADSFYSPLGYHNRTWLDLGSATHL